MYLNVVNEDIQIASSRAVDVQALVAENVDGNPVLIRPGKKIQQDEERPMMDTNLPDMSLDTIGLLEEV